jgi:hypothetical protein
VRNTTKEYGDLRGKLAGPSHRMTPKIFFRGEPDQWPGKKEISSYPTLGIIESIG